jgi:hypothetical protein
MTRLAKSATETPPSTHRILEKAPEPPWAWWSWPRSEPIMIPLPKSKKKKKKKEEESIVKLLLCSILKGNIQLSYLK